MKTSYIETCLDFSPKLGRSNSISKLVNIMASAMFLSLNGCSNPLNCESEILLKHRFSGEEILSISDLSRPSLEKNLLIMHSQAVPVELPVSVTLRFYASGCIQNVVGSVSSYHLIMYKECNKLSAFCKKVE